jgi:hypothetical protein
MSAAAMQALMSKPPRYYRTARVVINNYGINISIQQLTLRVNRESREC